MCEVLLNIEKIVSGYGNKLVIQELSLEVRASEIAALVGPNGAGKSTLLKTIFGLLRTRSGTITFNGMPIQNRHPVVNAQDGLAYVPQGARVFTELSVAENLAMGAYTLVDPAERRARYGTVLAIFPPLREREHQMAARLSTGEKQMLAIARGLMLRPQLLLVDEPSLGLAPRVAHEVIEALGRLQEEWGTSIILVEQNVREALGFADRIHVLRLGKIVLTEQTNNVTLDALRDAFLG